MPKNWNRKKTGFRQEWYPESYRPADTVAAHLQFHLRNEIVQLKFLQRLFERLDSQIIQDWLDAETTGQYARRTAFLYEWLTDKDLRLPDNIGGNYVDVLSDKWLVTSSPKAIKKIADGEWMTIWRVIAIFVQPSSKSPHH